ncbi:TPA: cell surface composition regulator GlgS [Citrobacter freundii]
MLVNNNMDALSNYDFLAQSFARMQAQGRPVDIRAVTGNMDEEHRCWVCKRYALYCQQATQIPLKKTETGLES